MRIGSWPVGVVAMVIGMTGTAIITGASRGVGLAAAQLFVEAGWDVIGVSRSRCPLPAVRSVHIDLAAPSLSHDISRQLLPTLTPGRICVVHNAARLDHDTATTITAARMHEVLALNVVAPALLNAALLPRMTAGSSVIFVGSTLSEQGASDALSYVTTKHAVAGLMRATTQDIAGTGVHAVCICPGFIDTDMLRARVGDDEEKLTWMRNLSGMGRVLEPMEVARLIVFCADNPSVGGAVLHANLSQRQQ
jgi:3-oxoacyl-[acyl-carrier protein] reductase